MAVLIESVIPSSPAAKARIKAGDTLLTINGREIEDVLDYRFYMPDSRLTVTVQTPKGKCRTGGQRHHTSPHRDRTGHVDGVVNGVRTLILNL